MSPAQNCLSCPQKAEFKPRDELKISCEKYRWEISRDLAAKQMVCKIDRKEEKIYTREEKRARRIR